MKIVEALKDEDAYLRLSNNRRWLIWNSTESEWVVYEHKPYAKQSTVVCQGADEEAAADALLKG